MANQNVTQLSQQTGSAAATSLLYAVVGGNTDTGLPLSVFVNNLGLTGTPTTPTATAGTNTTQIASTAYVMTSFAPLTSPTFTGTVVIPTVTLSGGTINGTSIGATTASTGAFTTLSASGLISPTSTVGIKGTTAADNAQAGSVGEYVSASALSVSITSGVQTNMTSISLTAGDWDLDGMVQFNPAGTTVMSNQLGAISTTSGVVGSFPTYVNFVYNPPAGQGSAVPVPRQRLSLSVTTTVYVIAEAGFSTSTCTANGFIRARRVR